MRVSQPSNFDEEDPPKSNQTEGVHPPKSNLKNISDEKPSEFTKSPSLDSEIAVNSGFYQSPCSDGKPQEENMHCLIVEEEHEMSQLLEKHGLYTYRLTHRNADSGAANGLLTRIKNGYFRAVIIHMPVKKKDTKENKYHAHIRNLVSWTRQAHENEIPVLWIGPFGNAWNEFEIRNMQNELKLFLTHPGFAVCKSHVVHLNLIKLQEHVL